MEAANSKMVYDGEDIAFNRLEVCNYRHLQGLAKQMGLPSNVKKVELIEMIRAKRYCSEIDLETIVNRIKMERKATAQLKRNKQKKKNLRLQGMEVSSTSQSPPITLTPVRPSEYVIQYSSESPTDIMKPNPRPSVVEAGAPFLQKFKSDRVLRSYNSMRRPNYRILDQTDSVVGIVKSRNTIKEIRHRERIQHIQEIRQDRAFRSVNVTVQKQRPVLDALMLSGDRQLVPVISRSINTGPNPTKRQRKVSGIYPLECQENPGMSREYMPTVNFRQTDGRVCKINAVIQRPLANTLLPKNHTFLQKKSIIRRDSSANGNPSPCVTVQDVINYEVDHPTVDLTVPRAIEPNKVPEIDHSNGIHRPSYEHYQQIEPMSKLRQIEQPIQEYQSKSNQQHDQNNDNAVKLSYQGRTLLNIVPEKTTEKDQNRKVYKNRQSQTRKGWSIEIDQEPKVKRAKYKRDLNDQSMNTTDGSTSQCFSHKTREYRNQVPAVTTNNKVVPITISTPMSREPRFDQEIRDRNMEYARNAEHARNVDHSRDMDYTRSAEHNTNMEDYNYSRHVDYARNSDVSCTELAMLDHARNVDPNNNRARNAEYARNTDLSAIEAPRTETDLRNQYPNMSSLTDVLPNEDYTQQIDMQSQYSVYYHKKIKAEQMRCNKVEKLPRINEVFSQFNDNAYKKLIQPLYVKVSEESDRVPIPMTINVNNACLLESIYNFKSQFLTNPPPRRIAPQTNCTYSTKTVPTAVEQSAVSGYNDHCNPYERASAYQLYNEAYQPCSYEYGKPEGQRDVGCYEVMNSPTVTIDTQASQDLDDNVTIPSPEMVEDALELISQDGDYMERIGMDVRVQCIICGEWAGPKFIMEYHIKKEHHHDIHHISSLTSRVQLSLPRSPAGRAWSSQLLQYRDSLFALSAQRNETSLLLAFSAIPNDLEIPRRCRITVCNKRLGQPLSYECEIKHIPDSMPYEYGQECLALDLASLDLTPSVGSPGKVVGQPELDRMELAVYIQLFD